MSKSTVRTYVDRDIIHHGEKVVDITQMSIDSWINKTGQEHTMKYYWVLKRITVLIDAEPWVNLEDIVPKERRDRDNGAKAMQFHSHETPRDLKS